MWTKLCSSVDTVVLRVENISLLSIVAKCLSMFSFVFFMLLCFSRLLVVLAFSAATKHNRQD